MIACDIDGTLLDYDYAPGQPPKINYALIEQLRGKEIALVTNQGGLPFGVKGAIRRMAGLIQLQRILLIG